MDAINSYASTQNLQYANAPKVKSTASFDHMAPGKTFNEKARETATEFESFFLYQMLELTDPGSPEGFDGGHAEKAFKRILNENVADEIAKSNTGIGLADSIYDQLIKIQETNQ